MKVLAIVMAGLLAACSPPAQQDEASAVLESPIADIRSAAGRRDLPGARRALEELRANVQRLRRSNDLTEQKAERILDAADDVARLLALIAAPSPTPTRRSPTPSPTPSRTPSPTPKPTPTSTPEPEPTEQPTPTQTSEPNDDGDEGSGNQGGLPGFLNGQN